MEILRYFAFLRISLSIVNGQEYVIERLGGRDGRTKPSLGIKCTTAELRILNDLVEECLESALKIKVEDLLDDTETIDEIGEVGYAASKIDIKSRRFGDNGWMRCR